MNLRYYVYLASIFFAISLTLLAFNNCGQSFESAQLASEDFVVRQICTPQGKLVRENIPFEKIGSSIVIDGDIRIGGVNEIKPGHLLPLKVGTKLYSLKPSGTKQALKTGGVQQVWPNGIIPYLIHPSIAANKPEDAAAIETNIKKFNQIMTENNIQLQFSKRQGQAGFIHFIPLLGENNFVCGVGCNGFEQREVLIEINQGCFSQRTILHETFHCLGFAHEHQRNDRDKYVTVDNSKGRPGYRKFSEKEADIVGQEYDFASISHYGLNSAMKLKPGFSADVVGGKTFSKNDIAAIAKMYSKDVIEKHPGANPIITAERPSAIYFSSNFVFPQNEGEDFFFRMKWHRSHSKDLISHYEVYKDGVQVYRENDYAEVDTFYRRFEDRDVKPGATHTYHVLAVTVGGIKGEILQRKVKIPGNPEELPSLANISGIKAEVLSASSIKLTWMDPFNKEIEHKLSGYNVLQQSPFGGPQVRHFAAGLGRSVEITGLFPEIEYEFYIFPESIYGTRGAVSPSAKVTIPKNFVPPNNNMEEEEEEENPTMPPTETPEVPTGDDGGRELASDNEVYCSP